MQETCRTVTDVLKALHIDLENRRRNDIRRERAITQVRTLKNNMEIEKTKKEDKDNNKETGSGGD